ncbi:uncharacterized protein LOC134797368 [Cydia splendana]|uniref:uncharacterized protein LOC134797368 n=1 Tax=Cydia splendana TaxID=1100963 RepID=UPI00300D33F5
MEKVKKLFYKLQTFIRPTWGVHPENIRTIYEHVVEPIMTYLASVWKTALKYKYVNGKLLSLQRLFAIKCIRGFRTLSMPLSITLAKLTPLPAKVTYVAEIELTRIYGHASFLPDDLRIESPVTPGALLHPVHRQRIEYQLLNTQEELVEAISSHSDPSTSSRIWHIYTDGSQTDDKVGSAFVIIKPNTPNNPIVKKLKLHNCCSVFQAELLAIKEGLRFALEGPAHPHKILVFSDSRAGLTELANPNSYNNLVNHIHKLIERHKEHTTVQFFWVKAHCGILGN